MAWIKFTHTGGTSYLNLDQHYLFQQSAPADLTFYSVDSTSPVITYSFASADDLFSFIKKLEALIKVIDIDQLVTPQ